MKPNEKQKDLISKISSEIAGWANTNDIDSQSMYSLIEEFCQGLELQENDEKWLIYSLEEMFTIIKRTKEQ
jgi:hypothetical protein